jgi:hypothetical protein
MANKLSYLINEKKQKKLKETLTKTHHHGQAVEIPRQKTNLESSKRKMTYSMEGNNYLINGGFFSSNYEGQNTQSNIQKVLKDNKNC